MRKLGLAIIAAGALVASGAFASPYVTDDLAAAKAMQPTGSAFNGALHKEYVALGTEALAESDHQHAHRYVKKGTAAAQGQNVLPEDPRTWWLPPRSRAELYDWHGKLNAKLDGNWRTSNPALAARAQAMYDCWVEEEHEDVWTRQPLNDPNAKPYQPEDIAKCKNAFLAAMQGPAMKQYIVYFAFDKSNLDARAQAVIREVIAAARAAQTSRISVYGHTDRSGSEAYNLDLSKRRAASVQNALVRGGVQANRITSSAFGESRPAVATADGVREARNRRAEITIE
ncbi:MAG: OmpA family protein [Alphaproteobacteria bacterium]